MGPGATASSVRAGERPGHRQPVPGRLLAACLALGGTGLVGQVVLTRELLCLFSGNELSIALVLAVWLIATTAGAALASRLRPFRRSPVRGLGWLQTAAAALLPLSLLLARRMQPGSLGPGEVPGPAAMLAASFEVLAPLCLLLGFQFVTAVEAIASAQPRAWPARSAAALAYAAEAAGAVVGGLAFHAWAAQHLPAFATLASVSLVTVASACALLRPRAALSGPLALLAAGLLLLAATSRTVEVATLRASPRWSGLAVVASVPSRYGAILVGKQAGQASLYQSGVLLFTSQDEYTDEVMVHFPLLAHPSPQRVLLLGGDLAGEAREALKHPIAHVDCLELDPEVTAAARQWLPSAPARDPRVAFRSGDGRLFVRHAQGRYDVIIVSLPDPTTAAINRFYTSDFFWEAKRALADRGLLALSLTGSEAELTGALQLAAATTWHTLSIAFPDRLLVPGERMLFLASVRPGALTSDWRALADRLARRRVATHFVNDVWLRNALDPLRTELAQAALAEVPNPPLNTDLKPISYYQQTRVWLDQLSPRLSAVARGSVWCGAAAVALALASVALARGRRRRIGGVFVAAVAFGSFGMTIEVVALLVLQSASGYLYGAMALLLAAFMAGLALGAALPAGRRAQHSEHLLLGLLATAAGLSLVLPVLSRLLMHAPQAAPPALAVFLLLAGSLVGAAYPVLTALVAPGPRRWSAAGAVYALDLLGSAAACLVVGVIAVPLLGLAGTSLACAAGLGVALLLAAVSVSR